MKKWIAVLTILAMAAAAAFPAFASELPAWADEQAEQAEIKAPAWMEEAPAEEKADGEAAPAEQEPAEEAAPAEGNPAWMDEAPVELKPAEEEAPAQGNPAWMEEAPAEEKADGEATPTDVKPAEEEAPAEEQPAAEEAAAEEAPAEAEEDAEGFPDVHYVLYLGTNDAETNKPVFTQAEAQEALKEILIRHFGGYTIQEASGGWVDGGTLYQEYTLVIYLSDTTPEKVHEAAAEMAETFRQSSVLIEAIPTRTEFYAPGK